MCKSEKAGKGEKHEKKLRSIVPDMPRLNFSRSYREDFHWTPHVTAKIASTTMRRTRGKHVGIAPGSRSGKTVAGWYIGTFIRASCYSLRTTISVSTTSPCLCSTTGNSTRGSTRFKTLLAKHSSISESTIRNYVADPNLFLGKRGRYANLPPIL